ncbi:MAG: zinc ribbon domain-containing protein [Candidatus Aminicenantes bacterium]|nr:zinc ribbon domain-containing protein [Candidatus Aminicenantes bacterium]
MPLYEYRCRDCGRVTEVLVRSQSPETDVRCPGCGGNNLLKIVSQPAVISVSPSLAAETCCGKSDRCDSPPCSSRGTCRRD